MAQNPITIQPINKKLNPNAVTLARLRVGIADTPESLPKTLHVVISPDGPDVKPVMATIDEDVFLEGLRQLFPEMTIERTRA